MVPNACSWEVGQDVLEMPSNLVELQTLHHPCITCSITLLLNSVALTLFGLEAQIWPRVDLGVSLTFTSMSDSFIFWKGIWHLLSDSRSARAMPRNAVNLPVPLPRGSLTVGACVTACGNAGQFLTLLICISFPLMSKMQATPLLGLSMQTSVVRAFACGVWPFDYSPNCSTDCGHVIESNSQPITGADCSLVPNIVFDPSQKGALMPCKGNPNEFCGGPDIIAIYTLPGTGLVPILPFDPMFDGFCGDCLGHT